MDSDRKSFFWLVGPFLLLWVSFWLVPFCFGFELSLKDSAIQSADPTSRLSLANGHYIGFENYKRALSDDRFWKSLSNSFYYVLGSLIIILPLSFSLSLSLLAISRFFRSILAFCLIIPSLAMPGILSTMFYLFFHGREGALNQYFLIPLGFEPVNWMMDPKFILPSMIFQSVWRWTGIVTFFLLCALEGIPRWQLEVARMEGLGKWGRLTGIWFPAVRKLMLFAAIFLTVEGFASFSGAYVLLGGSGGILDSGLLFVTYLYQVAFPGGSGRFDFPTASAMSMLVAPAMSLVFIIILKVQGYLKSI